LNVVCVDPRTDSVWSRLVERSASSVFHSPSWIQVLSDTYGWEPSAYVVLDDRGEPRAGIPFCRISDVLGDRIVALPFSDYCDPLVSDPDTWRLLTDRLLPMLCPISVRCLHNSLPLADERFTLVKRAKWHGLDLRPDSETLWRGIDDSAHRAIRKSQREGIRVRTAQSEQELRIFFEMHLKVRKYKYGLLAQPFSFFQNIWRHFVQNKKGFLLLAVDGDKILAGDFFLEWKQTLYYKFNASVIEDLSHRPNDLLIWEAIQCAKLRSFTVLDLGLSDWDQEGLVRYKRKFGTQEKTISFLRCAPNGSTTPAENEMRDLLAKLTTRFTDQLVPDPVTERAGEDLYRLFT
jgi:CelD/BcsL family acetyltransferase involved in cellulose biosynthesis